ncbi:hypothetical protein BE08_26660 [Sorangium cellulosum]|uniref:Uncharacterized protein n=1 Tax=Sorangium cellulosum TaxID=56 RepID=A0A150P0N8_SORCE|nr:hypothetical protein BE08_26660 [Sorangium cellulosum]
MANIALLSTLAGCAGGPEPDGWWVVKSGESFTVIDPEGDATSVPDVTVETSQELGVARQALGSSPGGTADIIRCKNCHCTKDFCACDECTFSD